MVICPFDVFPCSPLVLKATSLEWISAGLLDLDAEYQRGLSFFHNLPLCLKPKFIVLAGIVWNEQKQIGLIDSIFRNYYIPPIVFSEF